MSEQMPGYSYEKVFAESRSTGVEQAVNPEIGELGPEEIGEPELLELADDLESQLDQLIAEIKNDTNPDWPVIFDGMLRHCGELVHDPDNTHPLKQAIIRSFYLAGPVLGQVGRRKELNNRLDDIDDMDIQTQKVLDEKTAIFNEFTGMNIFSATWQNETAKTMIGLRGTQSGQEKILNLWQRVQELATLHLNDEGQKEYMAYRRGIEGFVAVRDLFKGLGYETFFPFAKQDAVQKIDLWARRGDKAIAIQIKAHKGSEIRVKVERPRAKVPSLKGFSNDEKKDVRARNTLLSSCEDYSEDWNREVVGLWVDLSDIRGFLLAQDKYGQALIPDNLNATDLAQEIEQAIQ